MGREALRPPAERPGQVVEIFEPGMFFGGPSERRSVERTTSGVGATLECTVGERFGPWRFFAVQRMS